MLTSNWYPASLLRQLFLPSICLLCSAKAGQLLTICAACNKDLPSLPESCWQCGKFFPGTKSCNDKTICGACLRKPPAYDYTLAAFPYQSPIVEMISRFKFQGDLRYGKLLSQLFTQRINVDRQPSLIIPMPLHVKRLRERGFNQSLLLARDIAKFYSATVASKTLIRQINTRPQLGLSSGDREKNMRNAFKLQSANTLRDQDIIILDDVMTTGSSVNAACRLLKQAQPKSIGVFVLARNG